MRKISQEELEQILKEHSDWLKGNGGKRADLRYADLRCAYLRRANLSEADLRYADLRRADLSCADLSCADLSCADLSCADLRRADLRYANLEGANLIYADLSCANLRYADLSCADLRYADLRNADLRNADLSGADLEGVNYNETTAFFALQCPEEGSFIAWKKCKNNFIVKLLIPEDAKRSSSTTRKCRCDKAVVIAIFDSQGNEINETISSRDSNFVYKKGETVKVDDFDEDRWNECSTGIHFFITRKEAELYK